MSSVNQLCPVSDGGAVSHQSRKDSTTVFIVCQVQAILRQAVVQRRFLQLVQPGQQPSEPTTGPRRQNKVGEQEPSARLEHARCFSYDLPPAIWDVM